MSKWDFEQWDFEQWDFEQWNFEQWDFEAIAQFSIINLCIDLTEKRRKSP
ncbi:hypothetical protein [Baaleninema sp.]